MLGIEPTNNHGKNQQPDKFFTASGTRLPYTETLTSWISPEYNETEFSEATVYNFFVLSRYVDGWFNFFL